MVAEKIEELIDQLQTPAAVVHGDLRGAEVL
jgi:fructosamine-3-kinase